MATDESSDRWRALSAGGFAAASVGLMVTAAGAHDSRPVPAGAVVLLGAAALVWWVRRRWVSAMGAVLAVIGLLNVADDDGAGSLVGDAGPATAVGKWLLLLGAATALTAQLLALLGRRPDERRRTSQRPTPGAPSDRRGNALQVIALLVLAPVCAEYLAAYDDSTGDAVQLIGGLLVFSWLYGAPALLIREVARRAGLGWPGIIILGAVFGLMEAGLVDQSLFALHYRDIPSWDDDLRGTFIGSLGLSAYNVVNFVGGHVIYSICAPIALVEAFRPSRHREPWLTPWTIGALALLYAAVSALVLGDHLANESSHASIGQLIGSSVVIAALVAAAFLVGRRSPVVRDAEAASVVMVFTTAVGVALVYALAPTTWLGVTLSVLALGLGGALLQRTARSRGWGLQHVVAVAAAFVLTRAVLSFTYFPLLGDVSAVRKYGHSTVLLVLMLVVCAYAWRSALARMIPPPRRCA